VAAPRPPNQNEEEGIAQETGPGVVCPQRRAHFRYCGHEDEIEEQLHPGNPAVSSGIGDPKARCLYETLKVHALWLGPEPEEIFPGIGRRVFNLHGT
jgi:hypothetical protein